MKLRKKLLKCIIVVGCIPTVLIGVTGCTKKVGNVQTQQVEGIQTQVTTDGAIKIEEQIAEETKPEEDKTIIEIENKANMIIEYKGFIKSFSYEGSRGNLELVVGEPNTDSVENMLFKLNLDNILYDASLNSVLPPNNLYEGDDVVLYAMDNSVTSAITPIAIVKNPTTDLNLISLDRVEKFEVKDVKVNIIHDKFSSNLICVDDRTIIENAFSGEPVQLDEIKGIDKLFIKTTKRDSVNTSEKDKSAKDEVSEEDKLIEDMYEKTKLATHISVYKGIE